MIRLVFDRTNPAGVRAVLYEDDVELAAGEVKTFVVEATKDLRTVWRAKKTPRKPITEMLRSVITRCPARTR